MRLINSIFPWKAVLHINNDSVSPSNQSPPHHHTHTLGHLSLINDKEKARSSSDHHETETNRLFVIPIPQEPQIRPQEGPGTLVKPNPIPSHISHFILSQQVKHTCISIQEIRSEVDRVKVKVTRLEEEVREVISESRKYMTPPPPPALLPSILRRNTQGPPRSATRNNKRWSVHLIIENENNDGNENEIKSKKSSSQSHSQEEEEGVSIHSSRSNSTSSSSCTDVTSQDSGLGHLEKPKEEGQGEDEFIKDGRDDDYDAYSSSIPFYLLLEDKWRKLFDKYDCEGFGEIPWTEFFLLLRNEGTEFYREIPAGKRQLLEYLGKIYSEECSAITFQCFINIMTGKRSRSFKCAVHHRDREVLSENDFHILKTPPPPLTRMARLIADEFLTEERDRKYYADHYRCVPPPLFIISVTLIELGFFTYYSLCSGISSSPSEDDIVDPSSSSNPSSLTSGNLMSSASGPLPIDSPFVYRPDKRDEIWRFFVYMVLHAGWVHLMFNLMVQLLVGLPLEMVHGSLRIGIIYMAGVLAGSLGTSVFDPDVYLVGASGGVYALLAAHLANVLLNYNNMEFGILRLLGVFLIASVDVGFAIYDRYASPLGDSDPSPPVSYVAHLTGALAGLTIGLVVLKNFEQRLREQLMWWIALSVYAVCTVFAILFNIFRGSEGTSQFIEVGEPFPTLSEGGIGGDSLLQTF